MAKKRKVTQVRVSPKRKTSTRLRKPTTKKAEMLANKAQRGTNQSSVPGSSNPVIKLITAATRQKKDFHNPSASVP